jgi:hypothetical protein
MALTNSLGTLESKLRNLAKYAEANTPSYVKSASTQNLENRILGHMV